MSIKRNSLFALAIFITGCNAGQTAEETRQLKIKEATERVEIIAAMISKAEERQSQLVSRINYIKQDSPIISYCILNDLFKNGVLVTLFPKNENEKTAGTLAAAGCGLAMLHDEYNSIEAEIESINSEARSLEKRIIELSISKEQAESELIAIQNQGRP